MVTVLLSLYDCVEKVERHSEQLGVVYDKVVDRVISIPQSSRYEYHITVAWCLMRASNEFFLFDPNWKFSDIQDIPEKFFSQQDV